MNPAWKITKGRHTYLSRLLFSFCLRTKEARLSTATQLTVINDTLLLLRLRTATPGSVCN